MDSKFEPPENQPFIFLLQQHTAHIGRSELPQKIDPVHTFLVHSICVGLLDTQVLVVIHNANLLSRDGKWLGCGAISLVFSMFRS